MEITPESVQKLAQSRQVAVDQGYACQHCERPFDPVSHRWLCPHCHVKNTCCE